MIAKTPWNSRRPNCEIHADSKINVARWRVVPSKRRRRAVTLIELLASLAIVSILLAMLIPAVQNARESSRRARCANNFRQLGIGVHGFHLQHRILPPNGGPSEDSVITAVDGRQLQPYTYDALTNAVYRWGVGDPKWHPRDQRGSWCYAILPLIEYQNEHANNAHDVTLTLFQCPSRSQRNALPPIEDRFGAYESGGHRFAKTDYCANNNACPNRPDFTSLKAFADGVSNTALIGEKAFDPTVQTETSWYWDEPIWLGGSKGTARAGAMIVPDGVGIEFRERWGAPHSSSAHFCFADGSVHLLASTIDQQILAALMTLNGQDDNPRIASE